MRMLHRTQDIAVCTFAVLFAFASMWLHPAVAHAQTNGIWASGTAGTFNWDDPFNWMNGSVEGWAAYKVADQVKTHKLYGGGVYVFYK